MKTGNKSKLTAALLGVFAAAFLSPMSALCEDVRQVEARLMKQAEENIEKHRKGDVTIQFRTRDGKRYDDLLAELKKRNAPLSGIGIQAHEPRQEWFSPEEVWKTFDLYERLGYPIHITEFHPQSSGVGITGGWRTGSWTAEAQAEFTEQFVNLCFGHPAVVSINWWGFSDRNIWLPGGGLVDEEYRPKPVYQMLDKLINQTWKTNISGQTDDRGLLSFRGFWGEYEIVLNAPGGKSHVFPVHVRKNEEDKWVFTVDGDDDSRRL